MASITLPRGALTRLKRVDPALGRVITRVGDFAMQAGAAEGHLEALVRSIIYQQLSGKAAATIYGRFRALFGQKFPTPAEILDAEDDALRGCGLSRAKLAYVRDLCAKIEDGSLTPEALDDMGDELIIEALTRVHGFGRWSAEIFLMFHLGRLDVWPAADLGIRKAIAALHEVPMPSPREATLLGERYRPYRTVASWYLWRSLEQ